MRAIFDRSLVGFMWFAGVLTLLVAVGVLAPDQIQRSMFGAETSDAIAIFLTRAWSGLIGIMGLLLIFGARSEALRTFCLNIAAGSKAMFIAIMLFYGQAFLASAGIALLIDACVVLVALVNQVMPIANTAGSE